MMTSGVVQRIEGAAAVRTEILDAEGDQPVLTVLAAAFGAAVSPDDLRASNPEPCESGDTPTGQPASRTEAATVDPATLTWGEWRSRHPVTLLGAEVLSRGSGPTAVTIAAGPDSGFSVAIDPRETCVSRVPQKGCLLIADPCLSRHPVPLDLDPSRARTHTALGSTVVVTEPGPDDTRAAACASSASETIHVAPATVEEPRAARPPQWWAFLIPIGIGIALALLTGMWWFLLFSLSAPLSGYIAHVVEKRRFARDTLTHRVDCAKAIGDAQARAEHLVAVDRRTAFEDPGLRLGFGAALSRISLDPILADSLDHFDEHAVIADVPLCVDPQTTSILVTGRRTHLLHMLLAWLADQRWAWVPSAAVRGLPELVAVSDRLSPAAGTESPPGIAVDLCTTGSLTTLRLVAPSPTSTISLVLGSLARAHTANSTCPNGPVPGRTFTAALMPPARFLTTVRSRPGQSAGEICPQNGLREHLDDAPAAIAGRWAGAGTVSVPIGRCTDGAVAIDLFDRGPHALVAGTTGSGKSMLLQTWLLALALTHPPEALTFVLIDFKGGATFAPLEQLPHTDSVLDDFDSAAAFRALVAVRAEITRRERLLADHGCGDVRELAAPPPRLVVVIDEFHALMSTHPKAADLLEHLTALGRSLGVHLILATQRPLGVVTGHMKANINIRVCLRVRDESDSFDVIGIGDAAHLPADRPGTAYLDSGSSLTLFRVAAPFTPVSASPGPSRPRLRPWGRARLDSMGTGIAGIEVSHIAAAASDRRAAFDLPGDRVVPGHRVVPPPLPRVDDLSDVVASAQGGSTVTPTPITGIIDIPAAQQQFPWTFDPTIDGSTLIISDDDADIAEVLTQLAAAAAQTHRIVALGRVAAVIDRAEVRCGMNSGWRLHTIIDHLGRSPATATGIAVKSAPTAVVCGNWSELGDSLDHHDAAALERLLTHARGLGLTFLLAGCRTSLGGTSLFRTRVIFPPSSGGDGLSVGLSRQRFLGSWPRLRAVLVGPRTAEAGRDGADVQFLPAAPSSGPGGGPQDTGETWMHPPRWCGLGTDRDIAHVDLSTLGTPGSNCATIPLGVDPFGEIVGWNPGRDGTVLTVRGSARSGRTELTSMLARLQARSATAGTADPAVCGLRIHDDAHLLSDGDAADLLDGSTHVLTLPLRFSPGYGSPLAKMQTLGPTLILGSHSTQDLTNLGFLRLPPLDGAAGTGWFVTESGAHAVTVFRATAASHHGTAVAPATAVASGTTGATVRGREPREPAHGESVQRVSAGGPVRVS